MNRLLFVALVACSGGHTAPAHPTHARGDGGAPAADRSPGEAECDQLFAHAVALGQADEPQDRKPTDDDQLRARADAHAKFTAECQRMSRPAWSCAVAAKSLGELADCDQASLSSSTSNSSVAPAGINPPAAPRSP